MSHAEWDLVARILVAWGLTFALGFERQIRGAMAGDRTFSLLGASTALIGVLSGHSPTILAGAVTGIGFIGGGLCFRQTEKEHEVLHGITTAATIFCAAAIGAACGIGYLWVATVATCAVLLTLEMRHIPGIRALDARRWMEHFHHDDHIAHHLLHRGVAEVPTQSSAPAIEAIVATPSTSDTDAVVFAEQEAAISAVTVDAGSAPAPAGGGRG